MRVLVLLMLSGVLLAQPNDSTTSPSEEIPAVIKPTVEKIVDNSLQKQKAEKELTKEMLKQIELMKEIKSRILELKKTAKQKNKKQKSTIDTTQTEKQAFKNNEIKIEVGGQLVQWETRKRTWLGRLLHTEDILYYPFIIDNDGNKIYLK